MKKIVQMRGDRDQVEDSLTLTTINTIITALRSLKGRKLDDPEVVKALERLRSEPEFRRITGKARQV